VALSTARRRIIDSPVRIVLLNERTARGLDVLVNFPCGKDADTHDEQRGVNEVRTVLHAVYEGRPAPTRVVIAFDDQEAVVSLAVVGMNGDGKLTKAPYIEALARHDRFSGRVLRDGATSAGGVAIHGVLDMLALVHGSDNLPTVSARVLPTNAKSHAIFTQFDFAALPRTQTHTEQVMRVRPPGHPLPPPLDPSIYIPPERGTRYVPRFATHARLTSHKIGRNDPCSCGSGQKYKRCCGG
jgi:SEC-C motif